MSTQLQYRYVLEIDSNPKGGQKASGGFQGGGAGVSGQQMPLNASHSREFTLQATASNGHLAVTKDPMVGA